LRRWWVLAAAAAATVDHSTVALAASSKVVGIAHDCAFLVSPCTLLTSSGNFPENNHSLIITVIVYFFTNILTFSIGADTSIFLQ